MCATYFIDDGTAMEMLEIINALNQKFGYETLTYDQIYPNGVSDPRDVYPGNTAPIGAVENEKITVLTPAWGFPVKDNQKKAFNARAENVKKYGVWKEAYASRRAFAPAEGFYEFKKVPGGKAERYYFSDPDGKLLFMAALLKTAEDKEGNPREVYTIITTDAGDSVADIHDRMPLLLDSEELLLWMTDQDYADSVLGRAGKRLVRVLSPKPKKESEPEQTSLFK